MDKALISYNPMSLKDWGLDGAKTVFLKEGLEVIQQQIDTYFHTCVLVMSVNN